ncbi:iron-containing alcohol dehydrogenase [Candidatus Enterococcus ferrettii]|uniref:Glycerol dehydrogenase n=1 Tax=Candidatus Enterococcus ferrettii TaxID=2815324 RepID=A0ABV0ESH0_9ENTE|nr:iron-containing alcohol dehydrogenase [Enterococcus sp. 665A]MBO1339235.1 iron-containing alcohol dehydrogenase [Enterococcus sp. 665A]
MEKVFVSPGMYLQGENILTSRFEELLQYGKRGLIVTDTFVYQLIGEDIIYRMTKSGCELTVWLVDTGDQIDLPEKTDFVLSIGGGRAIDLGKSIALREKKAYIVLPTSASTDAPVSRISVAYDEKGYFQEYHYFSKGPDLVFVDTAILVNSPIHLLTAGIADGLSTFVEARTVWENHGLNTLGVRPTIAAQALAEKCKDVLLANAVDAVEANKEQKVTPEFEAVVEANTLLSGTGFESGGLSIAHSLHNALMSKFGKKIKASHGQIIAVTTLIHLKVETRKELSAYQQLFQKLSLPITIKELGIQLDDAAIGRIAELAFTANDGIARSGSTITKSELIEAIQTFK